MGIQVHFRDFFGAYMCEFELCSKLTINEVVTGLVILNTDWFQKSYWRDPPRGGLGGREPPQCVDPLPLWLRAAAAAAAAAAEQKSCFNLAENC